MKKNKLIELLQKIEGNPEIYLWNGFVGDWCDIDGNFIDNELVKETFEHKLSCLEGEWCRDNNTFEIPDDVKISLTTIAEKQFKAQQWELPNQWVDSKEFVKWYGKHKKRIVIINHKERGKSYWDRMGDMNY